MSRQPPPSCSSGGKFDRIGEGSRELVHSFSANPVYRPAGAVSYSWWEPDVPRSGLIPCQPERHNMSSNRSPKWTLFALLPFTGCVRHKRPLIPTMDLCQLSRSSKRYDGLLIAVRGVYCGNLRQRCDQKCSSGESWPSHVDLVETDDRVPDAIRTDDKSVGELHRIVKELGKTTPPGCGGVGNSSRPDSGRVRLRSVRATGLEEDTTVIPELLPQN